MSKTVDFGAAPRQKKKAEPENKVQADQWVQNRATEGTKRLTIDIPASLHRRIKMSCVARDTGISEELRVLLESHYREDSVPT